MGVALADRDEFLSQQIAEDDGGAAPPAKGDHRVRVAAQRREKMRARLLDAVLETYSSASDLQLPTADHVARHAGVSRPTFYAHFDSVQDAVEALGETLIDEMVTSLASLFGRDGPLDRIVMGLSLFLMRAATDPVWARFVARIAQVRPETKFYRDVRRDLEEAAAAGEIEAPDIDAAISVALGAMFEAIRHLQHGGNDRRDYVRMVTIMTLRALGVEEEKAADRVRANSAQIRGLAPDHIAWWQDPWA